jgi:hypothetical protein
MCKDFPESAEATKDSDDGRATNKMIPIRDQMDRLFIFLDFVPEAFIPGCSPDWRVPEHSFQVMFQTESDKATAHGAVPIEEDDV